MELLSRRLKFQLDGIFALRVPVIKKACLILNFACDYSNFRLTLPEITTYTDAVVPFFHNLDSGDITKPTIYTFMIELD